MTGARSHSPWTVTDSAPVAGAIKQAEAVFGRIGAARYFHAGAKAAAGVDFP